MRSHTCTAENLEQVHKKWRFRHSREKEPNREPPPSKVDEFIMSLVKRTVYSLYSEGRSPTVTEILVKMKEISVDSNNPFPYGESTLKITLKKLGFKWKKSRKNRAVLIEKYHLKQWGAKHQRAVANARASGSPIFYVDETWYNTGECPPKTWYNTGECPPKTWYNTGTDYL